MRHSHVHRHVGGFHRTAQHYAEKQSCVRVCRRRRRSRGPLSSSCQKAAAAVAHTHPCVSTFPPCYSSLRHHVAHRDLALGDDHLAVDAALLELAGVAQSLVLGAQDVGEAPVLGCHNDLAARELHLGAAQGLIGLRHVRLLGAHGQQ
ncbi:hypothetical protein IOCL1545_000101700, partial [Leishmania shawi]